MGTKYSVSGLKWRTVKNTNISNADIVFTFNGIDEVMTGIGMLQVSNTLYPGQKEGAWIEADVPVAVSGTASDPVMGYKLFKHPSKEMYALFEYIVGKGTAANTIWQIITYRVTIKTSIGDPGASFRYLDASSGTAWYGGDISNATFTTHGYLDADNFWIYTTGEPVTGTATTTAYNWYVYKRSLFAFWVSNIDGNISVMVPPQIIAAGAGIAPLNTTIALNSGLYYGIRSYVYSFATSTWYEDENCSFSFIDNTMRATINDGVRFVQLRKFIDGEELNLPAAGILASTGNDSTQLSLTLDGINSLPYFIAKGFCGLNPARPSQAINFVYPENLYTVVALPYFD
jgi:hypothetical protein